MRIILVSYYKVRCQVRYFRPTANRDCAKRQWLSHTLISKGRVDIDKGAANALRRNGASLLPSGITQVCGEFSAGDAIDIVFDEKVIGKGICLYSQRDLRK